MNGQRFGRLLVVETLYGYGHSKIKACRCLCDCGNEKIVYASNLVKGSTQSCGCLERESRFSRKHGKYKPGQVCGGFTLIQETEKREKNSAIIWKCKCNTCGRIIEQSPSVIIKNSINSCGCDYVHPLLIDLTGQRFGLLTVESIVPRQKRKDPTYKRVMWNCICECGKHAVVSGDMLTSGRTTSCGCRMNKSAMVFLIRDYLAEKDIKFTEEYRFHDCRDKKALPFDFYLHDYNTAIEYDGEQHYKSVDLWGGDEALKVLQKHDEIKDKYCYDHNIQLIRLPYYLTADEIYKIIDELEPVTSKCTA